MYWAVAIEKHLNQVFLYRVAVVRLLQRITLMKNGTLLWTLITVVFFTALALLVGELLHSRIRDGSILMLLVPSSIFKKQGSGNFIVTSSMSAQIVNKPLSQVCSRA